MLGRLTSDAVTTLGTGVDGSVRRIEYAYDGQGNQYLITTYDAASGGSIVNQVQREFNGLGQMTVEYQQSGGAVNPSTSPKVQYTYDEMPSGADQSRLTSITYPDGYVLTYNYSSGLNSTISRLSSLSDSTGTLEAYSYMGLGTVVVRSHPQINVDLTYVGTPGDAGDEYAGLDRFGRVIEQKWVNTSTSTTLDDFQYSYDVLGNRTAIDNGVDSSFNQAFTYDDLSQLTGFTRGTHTQDFNYDAVGNATSVTTDGTEQDRTANAQNQITSISGATTPTYDANGNMLTDETGRQFVFDAWNHLVIVKNSGGTTLETFSYDGLGRRVTSNDGTTTTDLYYTADWQVVEEMQGGNPTARYVWSPVYVDAMIVRDRATGLPGTLDERLWVQQDANYNVTSLVDGTGSVVERYAYDPFGVVTIYSADYSTLRASSAYAWTQGFQGMFFDATSGLDLSRGRPGFSPTLDRWVSVDPSGFDAGDVNLYRFVGNNPAVNLDPFGLEVTKVSVEETARPHYSSNGKISGAFVWPVKFVINDIAHPCFGGLVIQHVRRVDKVTPFGKGRKIATPAPWDYWEAFWIPPHKTETKTYDLATAPAIERAIVKKLDIAAQDIKGTDWYISPGFPRSSGSTTYTGDVYYIDDMSYDRLSDTWLRGYIHAGGLPAIDVANNPAHQKEIAAFRTEYQARLIGPAQHNFTITWTGKTRGDFKISRTPKNLG